MGIVPFVGGDPAAFYGSGGLKGVKSAHGTMVICLLAALRVRTLMVSGEPRF